MFVGKASSWTTHDSDRSPLIANPMETLRSPVKLRNIRSVRFAGLLLLLLLHILPVNMVWGAAAMSGEPPVDKLRSKIAEERLEGISEIAHSSEPRQYLTELIKVLDDEDPSVVAAAADVLTTIGDPRTRTKLGLALKNQKDPTARLALVHALRTCGSRAQAVPVRDALAIAVNDGDKEISTACFETLNAFGDPDGLKTVVALWSQRLADGFSDAVAKRLLSDVQSLSSHPLSRSPFTGGRYSASGLTFTCSDLIDLANTAGLNVRGPEMQTRFHLAHFHGTDWSSRSGHCEVDLTADVGIRWQVFEPQSNPVECEIAHGRIVSVSGIPEDLCEEIIACGSSAELSVLEVLKGKDDKARQAAASMLGTIGTDASADPLIQVARREKDDNVKRALVSALRRVRSRVRDREVREKIDAALKTLQR